MNENQATRKSFSNAFCLVPSAYSRSRGITLLDTIVGSALMLVVFVGVAAAFQLSVSVVTNNKARAGAIALANDRMEYIRSLPYGSVGNAGSIPLGAIALSEATSSNGISYTIRSSILYGDDPADGTGSSGDEDGDGESDEVDGEDNDGSGDGIDNFPQPNPSSLDYKAVKTDVSWNSRQGTRHISFVTRIEPPNGVEAPCPPNPGCDHIKKDKFEDKFNSNNNNPDYSQINMDTSRYTEIQGNQIQITGNNVRPNPAFLYSVTITPPALSKWGTFE